MSDASDAADRTRHMSTSGNSSTREANSITSSHSHASEESAMRDSIADTRSRSSAEADNSSAVIIPEAEYISAALLASTAID